jgi:hypothetical protein
MEMRRPPYVTMTGVIGFLSCREELVGRRSAFSRSAAGRGAGPAGPAPASAVDGPSILRRSPPGTVPPGALHSSAYVLMDKGLAAIGARPRAGARRDLRRSRGGTLPRGPIPGADAPDATDSQFAAAAKLRPEKFVRAAPSRERKRFPDEGTRAGPAARAGAGDR